MSPPAQVTMAIRLAAGDAVWIPGPCFGGRPFSSTLYAIRTPDGVGFLVIDGPSDLMDVREADLELIPGCWPTRSRQADAPRSGTDAGA